MKKSLHFCLLFTLFLPGLLSAQEIVDEDSLFSQPSPVVFGEDTLFYIHGTIGSFTPPVRSEVIQQRLTSISQSITGLGDSLWVNSRETTTDILFGDIIIMSITDDDAQPLQISRDETALLFLSQIDAAFKKGIPFNNLQALIKNIGLILVALAGLFLFFYYSNRFFTWLLARIQALDHNIFFRENRILQFFKIITPKRERDLLLFGARVSKLGTWALFLIFYLPFVFSFLPWTRNIAQTIFTYLARPVGFVWEGVIGFLPSLFFIVVIFVMTRYLIRFLKFLAIEVERGRIRIEGFYTDWARPTFKIVRVIIYLFAFVVVFPYLPGSSSPAFQGVSIFLGLLLSLGSTTAVANIVAGVVITYMRPYQIGDRVRIAETIGDVTERTLLVTRVKTIKNEDITIPNAQILGNHLWNFTKHAEELGIILHTTLTIGYDVPSNTVRDLLIDAAKKTNLIEKEPEPFVFQKSLDDFYVHYELNAYTKAPSMMAQTYSEMNDHILSNFNEAAVEILSPHYSAIRDGNVLTVPKENIPEGYLKPGFQIEIPTESILRTNAH